MDSRTLAEVEGWLDQYVSASTRLDAGATAAVRFAYQEVSDWFDPAQTLAATAAAMSASQAGREAASALASQFMATVVSLIRQLRGVPALTGAGSRYPRNADPFRVYSRPVFAYRDQIAAGRTDAEALAAAFERAQLIADMDRILAERDAAVAQLEAMWAAEGPARYRRVLRPELSAGGSCGLCVAASQRVYSAEFQLPFHDRCKCKVMPLLDNADPAREINDADVARLYGDADGNDRASLKRTRYTIEQHGELGPYLVAEKVPSRRNSAPRTA